MMTRRRTPLSTPTTGARIHQSPRLRSLADVWRPVFWRLLRGLLILCCATLAACQVLSSSSASKGLQGRIAWSKDGDLWTYDLASKQQTKITNLPQGAAVTGATYSP